MTVEANIENPGVYINSLNDSYPASGDDIPEGDNHIRGIKNTITNTFTGITGEVTATHTELNILDGVTATTAALNILSGATSTDISSASINTGVINAVYPVGSIYISTGSTNPGTVFGVGTWAQISRGRTIVGEGTSDATYAAAATGGESTHQLTDAEMPSHNHSGTTSSDGGHTHNIDTIQSDGTGSRILYEGLGSISDSQNTKSSGAHTHTMTTDTKGSDAAHNNMPPYLVVYIWERTA